MPQEGPSIPCPFHAQGFTKHPKGAPPCFTNPADLSAPRLINMGALIYWSAHYLGAVGETYERLLRAMAEMGERVVALEESMAHLRKDILGT
jgi:hypothetical protein